MSTQHWLGMTVSLNNEQKEIHQFIVEWCIEMSSTYKIAKRPKPFHIFISGGAGTGKSHLIRTIVQTANRLLVVGPGEEDIVLMVCAFTGVAAFNIEGHTLHSAFNLPVNQSKRDDYIRLSGEQLSSMRGKLGNLCLLIIDEISMVGADHLYTVHRRLSEIMTSDEPFGGVSVLAVGDLSQLPPVAQKPVFAPVSDCIVSLYGSLWKKNFSELELHQIMRQKDAAQFAEALNRIRLSKHTENDIQLIKTYKE
jgi:ATP-dependent DNA helicase PIF1